jgi:hypothetical protein
MRKDDHMKGMKHIAIGILLLLAVSGAGAQSLGDYARSVRKNKPEPSPATRHYDNDNLPADGTLSVVGPPPASTASAAPATATANATPAPKTAADAAEHQKAADEWKKKIDDQKEKIDSLSHELDLEQREYRLRAAAFYGDAGTRLRNATQFDKDDAQYKSDVEGKQKAIDDAKQQLSELQEQAQKAGVVEKEKDSDNSSNTDKK